MTTRLNHSSNNILSRSSSS